MGLFRKTSLSALSALCVILGMSGIVASTIDVNKAVAPIPQYKAKPNATVMLGKRHSSSSSSSSSSAFTFPASSSSSSSTSSLLSDIVDKSPCQFTIRNRDINPNGFVITQAGHWCLGEDVVYDPATTAAAITIAASNVTLDLNTKTLSLVEDGPLDIDGIDVISGQTDIVIMNGTVRDFSRAGIVCVPPLNAGDVTTAVDIANIRALNNGNEFANVFVGTGGVVLFSVTDINITHCDLIGNVGSAITGTNVTKLTVDKSHCDDSTQALLGSIDDNVGGSGPQPYASGITLLAFGSGCSNILLKNSTFNRPMSGVQSYGIAVNPNNVNNQCSEIVIENCQADDPFVHLNDGNFDAAFCFGGTFNRVENLDISGSQFLRPNLTANVTSEVIEAIGLSCILCNNIDIDGCQFADSSISNYATCIIFSQGSGIAMDACNNFTISNSIFEGMSTQNLGDQSETELESDTTSIGIFESSQGTITNCKMTSNSATAPLGTELITCGLFANYYCKSIVIEDCLAANNQHTAENPEAFFSVAGGFVVGGELTNQIVFRRCSAINNQDAGSGLAFGFSTTDPYGFDSYNPFANDQFVFEACIADGNLSNGTAAGFDIHNLIGSKVINCVADRNNVGILVTEDEPGFSGNNLFEGNVLLGNLQAGILDTTTRLSNAYFSNHAESNGPSPDTTNYSGAIFPTATCDHHCESANKTPLRHWQLPYAPCKRNTNCEKPDTLDNISIER